MRIRLLLAAAILSLEGCDNYQTKPSDSAIQNMTEDIRYFRDDRSGLCYASVGQATSSIHPSIQLTWVPCQPQVLSLIGK